MEIIIETSTEEGLFALIDKDQIVWEKRVPLGSHLSNHLATFIQSGFSQVGVSARSIEKVIVGCGPGSYTGLRVGAALGQALSFSYRVPLYEVCSLQGLGKMGIPAFDARLGGIYVFLNDAPQRLSLLEFKELIPKGATIISPHSNKIQGRFKGSAEHWNWEKRELCPVILAKLARVVNGDTVSIHYLKQGYKTLKESLGGKN